MPTYPDFSPHQIIGVDVFLERFQTRIYVGKLEKVKNQFRFSYDPVYLKMKNILSLGPEFPLTQREFFSKDLFPSFSDRLPDPENPAYGEHCTSVGIAVTTTDPIVLLARIGKKGPSSFIFEPIYKDSFSFEDYEKLRKQLGLSMQDFALLFGISLSILQKMRAGAAEGKDILQRLELYLKVPEALEVQLKRNAKWLHSEKIKNVWKWLELKKKEKELKKNKWKNLSSAELDYTQECLKELSSCAWAKPLIDKINHLGFVQESMPILFEIRFAYVLYKKDLEVQHEYKAGVGKSNIDFVVSENNGTRWLIELTSLDESEEVTKNTISYGNFFEYSSTIRPGDTEKKEEVMGIIRAQRAILSKVAAKDKNGTVSPTKFPEPKNGEYNIIIIDMRGFLVGHSDPNDYKLILNGNNNVDDLCRRWWIDPKTGERSPIMGIFNDSHPDERSQQLRERIHGIGFICERHYANGEILAMLELFPNPKFFKNADEIQNLWPLKDNSGYSPDTNPWRFQPELE